LLVIATIGKSVTDSDSTSLASFLSRLIWRVSFRYYYLEVLVIGQLPFRLNKIVFTSFPGRVRKVKASCRIRSFEPLLPGSKVTNQLGSGFRMFLISCWRVPAFVIDLLCLICIRYHIRGAWSGHETHHSHGRFLFLYYTSLTFLIKTFKHCILLCADDWMIKVIVIRILRLDFHYKLLILLSLSDLHGLLFDRRF
jgi:hypothetical protein